MSEAAFGANNKSSVKDVKLPPNANLADQNPGLQFNLAPEDTSDINASLKAGEDAAKNFTDSSLVPLLPYLNTIAAGIYHKDLLNDNGNLDILISVNCLKVGNSNPVDSSAWLSKVVSTLADLESQLNIGPVKNTSQEINDLLAKMNKVAGNNPYFNTGSFWDDYKDINTNYQDEEKVARLESALIDQSRKAEQIWNFHNDPIGIIAFSEFIILAIIGYGLSVHPLSGGNIFYGVPSLLYWYAGAVGGSIMALHGFVMARAFHKTDSGFNWWTLTKPFTGSVTGAVTAALVQAGAFAVTGTQPPSGGSQIAFYSALAVLGGIFESAMLGYFRQYISKFGGSDSGSGSGAGGGSSSGAGSGGSGTTPAKKGN